jgi:hypothetical protein
MFRLFLVSSKFKKFNSKTEQTKNIIPIKYELFDFQKEAFDVIK